ncbi:MAG: hypothetical protein V5783_11235 [Pontiella sp.]
MTIDFRISGRAILLGIASGLVSVSAATDRMPEFSWDTVPRYMHVRKATAFTSEEIGFLATIPLITF